ncbi:MAG: SGNH/GDSL hydrolase family protein [Myxococcota bacterium]|jgi:hypothetical protein|nr:SGNH/GDSL hydrolase family protein [Myxococcota bacterium]
MQERSPLVEAGLGIAATVALFLLLETVASHFAPPIPSSDIEVKNPQDPLMRASPMMGWEISPGTGRYFGGTLTTINSIGTRNPEPTPKPDGALRLMTLGDSSIFGARVADGEVFSTIASELLSEHTGRTVEPINGGVPGYSSEQAMRLYRWHLADLEPDFLVIGTLWSDSFNSMETDKEILSGFYPGFWGSLQKLALYRLLDSRVNSKATPVQVEWEFQEGSGRYRVMPQDYADNLATLASEARKDGVVPVFLLLPALEDVNGVELPEPRPTYRDIMREVGTELDVLVVDAAETFRMGTSELFVDEVHPSALGHAVLGELLARELVTHEPDRLARSL